MHHDKPTPLVSILLATYNGEAYLEEQINSLLLQDYPNIEIIACDDASTDNTFEILLQFEKYTNFHIYRNAQNLGYIKNFEKLIELSNGDFTAFCDQDDIWHENKISALISIAEDTGCGLVYSDAVVIDRDGNVIHSSLRKSQNIEFVDQSFQSFYFYNCVTGCTSLARKNVIINFLPFPDGIIVHDWWIAFCFARIDRIRYTHEKLIRYRLHNTNQVGINRVSYKKIFKSFLLGIMNPTRVLKHKKHLRLWQKRYLDYFSACMAFEKANNRDSTKTEAMITWANNLDSSVFMHREFRFFMKTPETFSILPQNLRFIALISRLISFKSLNLIFYCMLLLWATALYLVISSLI